MESKRGTTMSIIKKGKHIRNPIGSQFKITDTKAGT
jgi:hypothetical protein